MTASAALGVEADGNGETIVGVAWSGGKVAVGAPVGATVAAATVGTSVKSGEVAGSGSCNGGAVDGDWVAPEESILASSVELVSVSTNTPTKFEYPSSIVVSTHNPVDQPARKAEPLGLTATDSNSSYPVVPS